MMHKKIVLSSVAVAALVLSGCGGGGGGAPEKAAKVSGTAVDDLILDGKVRVADDQNKTLAEGRTSKTDGTYSLDVAYKGAVVVSVTCDGNSTMLNPKTGAKSECGTDVSLNSVASVEPGVAQTVNITPLTQAVYERAVELAAEDNSTLNTDDIEKARGEIGTMFGVDPLSDDPADTNGTYATIIDSIHALADKSGSSVIDVTKELSDELKDGEADASSEKTMIEDLTDIMKEHNLTNNLTDSNGTYTPPENPAAMSDVEATKDFMKKLRNEISTAVDYKETGNPGFLDNEAKKLDEALNSVVMNTSYMSDVLNVLAEEIGNAYKMGKTEISGYPMGEAREFTLKKTDAGKWHYTITEDTHSWEGDISFPEVIVDNEAELFKSGTLSINVSGDVPLDYEAVAKEGVVDLQHFEGKISVDKRAGSSVVADISLSGKVSSNGTEIALKNVKAQLSYNAPAEEEEDPTLNYFKLTSIEAAGKVGDFTIDGTIDISKYEQNTKLKAKGGIYEVEKGGFGGQISCPHSAVASASVSIEYDGVTYTPTSDGLSYEYGFNFDDMPFNLDYDELVDLVSYSATCKDKNDSASLNIYWSWGNSDEEIANNGWLPSNVTFAGSIVDGDASLEGTLNAKWLNVKTIDLDSDDNEALVDVSLNGKLKMPEQPEKLTTLTFKNEGTDTNITANHLTASYTYDSTVINATADFDGDMHNGTVVITNQIGTKVELKAVMDAPMEGNVTKDGALIGTIEERGGVTVVKYIDGTFESIL